MNKPTTNPNQRPRITKNILKILKPQSIQANANASTADAKMAL
jgi:hypothetical protein